MMFKVVQQNESLPGDVIIFLLIWCKTFDNTADMAIASRKEFRLCALPRAVSTEFIVDASKEEMDLSQSQTPYWLGDQPRRCGR